MEYFSWMRTSEYSMRRACERRVRTIAVADRLLRANGVGRLALSVCMCMSGDSGRRKKEVGGSWRREACLLQCELQHGNPAH